MSRLALLILLLCAPLAAQADVEALISRLASDDWRTRERASRDLVALGEDAREGLRGALTHADPEVRTRASAALLEIGESFSYAVQCATGEDEKLSDHGRAALSRLFRIDDGSVLRQLTAQELQIRGYFGGGSVQINKAPVLALAQLTSLSGNAIVVSADAAERWETVMQQPTLAMSVNGGGQYVQWVVNALTGAMNNALGRPGPGGQLVARPMRVGREIFLYITPTGGGDVAQRCGRELVTMLLDGGPSRVKAAALLAEGAAGDTQAAERIRAEYRENPGIERLMWLALGLGADASVEALVREADPSAALELLASRDWSSIDMAARFLQCLGPEARSAALSPRIVQSSDALEATVALWLARGTPLSQPARERARELLTSRQESLAAAAAGWFAEAGALGDDELAAVWKAAESQPLGGAFLPAALTIVGEDAVALRLLEPARAALAGNLVTQQALAARVLAGRATAADIGVLMEKLGRARDNALLARQLTEMLQDAEALPEDAIKLMVNALADANEKQRDVYQRALLRLHVRLRLEICVRVMARLDELAVAEREGSESEAPAYVTLARIAMHGVRAGAGDPEALDAILKHSESAVAEYAKAAGRALAGALSGERLFTELEALRTRLNAPNGMAAAMEGYVETCRRAAEVQDRATFRRAWTAATSVNHPGAWQIRNELGQLQAAFSGVDDRPQRLPPALSLSQPEIDVE